MRDRYGGKHHAAVRVLFGALLALLVPFAAAVPGDRIPTVGLVDLDPGQDSVLGSGEPLYFWLRYRSAVPIHILLSGHSRGAAVHGFRHDSAELFPAGDREAVVWLAYPRDARIDRVHIRLWNANKAQVAAAAFPIRAEWTGARGPGWPPRGRRSPGSPSSRPDSGSAWPRGRAAPARRLASTRSI